MCTLIRIVGVESFSAAAKQIGATRTAISRQLQSLETLLGVKLLMHITYAMKLTNDGERGYQHARKIIDAWLALEDGLNIAEDEPVGTLRVRVPHTFGQQQLFEPFLQFLSRCPQSAIEWISNGKTVDFLSDNIDCAIRVDAEVGPAMVSVLLVEVPRSMITNPRLLGQYGELSHPEQLLALPWIAVNMFCQHSVLLSRQLHDEPVTLNISPRLSVDSIYVARNATLTGLGVTIVSSQMVTGGIANGYLVALLPEWHMAPLPIHLVYPWACYYPVHLRKFPALAKNVMPQLTGVKSVNQI